jgi:hypothetical protein
MKKIHDWRTARTIKDEFAASKTGEGLQSSLRSLSSAPTPYRKVVVCPNCGSKVTAESTVCNFCGNDHSGCADCTKKYCYTCQL